MMGRWPSPRASHTFLEGCMLKRRCVTRVTHVLGGMRAEEKVETKAPLRRFTKESFR